MRAMKEIKRRYFIFLLFVFFIAAYGFYLNESIARSKKTGVKPKQQNYQFTLWVETNVPPTDGTYYDQLANTLLNTPGLSFNKVLIRVMGSGAAPGEKWYNSMNPSGNNSNPYILELLRKLQGKNIEVYALPYISDVVPAENWDMYSGYVDDAPSLAAWMKANGGTAAYNGTLRQTLKWIKDINVIAQTQKINLSITGIFYEQEGSPYPPLDDDPQASIATLQAIKYYAQFYGLPNIKIAATAASQNNGPVFVGYSKQGVLDEAYLEMYNLVVNPAIDPSHNYVDALSATAKINNPIPARPNTIYTDAWLQSPANAGYLVWLTDPINWKAGQNMGFQHAHTGKNIGLLNYSFYNGGNGYYYGLCNNPGTPGCPKIYFMFSTECGPNPPPGITCDCVVAGCPQSKITAFGAWTLPGGLNQFLEFINLGNADWQLPSDQFAIFQYQLLPNAWVGGAKKGKRLSK